MCAILGWSGRAQRGQWRLVHRLLHELFIASVVRGGDASGFAAIDRQGQLLTQKCPVPSTLFASASAAWARLSYPSCVIAHCRAATHGRPDTGDNRSNHPFVNTDGSLAVVVNGVSTNYASVAKEYGLRLTSECDSEVVMRLAAAAEHPVAALETALAALRGGMAAAVLDRQRNVVWLARNESRPLWVFKLANVNGWFFCSTGEIGSKALARVFGQEAQRLLQVLIPVAADHMIGMSSQGQLIAPLDFPSATPPKHEYPLRLA